MGRLGFSCIAFLVGSSLALPVGAVGELWARGTAISGD